MSASRESADDPEVSSHALHGFLADLNIQHPPNHVNQTPTWTFPSSASAQNTQPPNSADGSIFSPRPSRYQTSSAPQLNPTPPSNNSSPPPAHQAPSQPSLFSTPNRSIFSSGPPTSSISSNTAQASMSSPPPVQSAHPLSALTFPSASNRKAVHYQNDLQSTPRNNRMPRAEKDVDDPSASHEASAAAERRGTSTPTALTRLFAAPEATPIISRHPSYIRTASGTAYTRASCTETAPLPAHLYNRGLLDGRHSDIAVHAFGRRYALHRLLLDRAPFFSSALSEPWFESSSKEIALHPEDIDSNITQAAFELALKRLYGYNVAAEEDKEAIGLFAAGCWLEMADLIEASVVSILRQMSPSKIGSLIQLVTNNYYGKNGDRILATTKAMLCREGWEMPLKYWDGVSGEIAREIIAMDGFFVPGEWERWVLAKRVLDRKLKIKAIEAGLFDTNGKLKRAPPDTMSFQAIRFDTVYRRHSGLVSSTRPVPESYDAWLALYTHPDVAALLVLLDEGIHYVHLSFEQLQKIRSQRDVLGLPLMPDKVINDALWMQMELRQSVVNAPELNLELGLSQESEEFHQLDIPEEEEEEDAQHGPTAKGKQRDSEVHATSEEDVMESGSWDGNGKPRKFWIPNVDSTSVTGANPDTSLYATPSTNRPYISRLSASIDPVDVQWASDFTASATERPTTADRNEPVPPISYTHYPPFRFAAEFPNPRNLKEKKRVYSRTVWYAGSLWNVYIQKVETTKNTQLGVYLHRAKEREGDDNHHHSSGSVDERRGQFEMLMRHNGRSRRRSRGDLPDEDTSNSSADPDSTLVSSEQPSRAATISNLLRGGGASRDDSSLTKSSHQTPSPFTLSSTLPFSTTVAADSDDEHNDPAVNGRESKTTNNSVPTLPTYVDGRPTIKTYFKIYSPSKGGRMLSVYESAPDLFNFSQSWGWKSSTMVLDDGLCGYEGAEGAAGSTGRNGKEGRLRFMVVIGMI
ncbi:hypothetical protein ACLMJK_007930 [Lecanora helva]